jgi:hypothetical protein
MSALWPRLSLIISNTVSRNGHSESSYWTRVTQTLSRLCDEPCPVPTSQFPAFVRYLYDHHRILNPTTPPDCLPFVRRFCRPADGSEFLVRLPQALGNPQLVVRTWRELSRARHSDWQKFISVPGTIDRIVDLFAHFFGPTEDRRLLEFRLDVFELVCQLVCENIQFIHDLPNVVDLACKVMIDAMHDAPSGFAVCFLRLQIQVLWVTLPQLPKKTTRKRLSELLIATSGESIVHEPVVRFLLALVASKLITHAAIAAALVSDLTEVYPRDLVILGHIARRALPDTQLTVVKYLTRTFTINSLFCRSAATILFQLLVELKGPSLTGWVVVFLKRLVVWIGLAFLRHRYPRRIARIAEVLASPKIAAVPWIENQVLSNIADLMELDAAPPYFAHLFARAADVDVNNRWKYEFLLFSKAGLSLKEFPFEKGTLVLLQPSEKPKRPEKKKPK